MNRRQRKKRDRKIGDAILTILAAAPEDPEAFAATFGFSLWRDLKHKVTPEQFEAERAQIRAVTNHCGRDE